jgi:hypothetical protein
MRSMRVSRASWMEEDSVYLDKRSVAEARRRRASEGVAVVQGRGREGRDRWKEPGGRRTTRSSKEGVVVVEPLEAGRVDDCDC